MAFKYRIGIVIACIIVVAASFLVFGLPYGAFGNSNVLASYNVTSGCGRGDQPTNGQLITISHTQAIFDGPAGSAISVNGTVLTLAPGATAWLVGTPVTRNGAQWQELCMATNFWVRIPY